MKNRTPKRLLISLLILVGGFLALTASSCETSESNESKAYNDVKEKADNRTPYIPHNDVEFNNYVKAQKLQDSPETIIWCSVMPQANTTPIITVPIAGKLTSSSTTFFQPEYTEDSGDGSVVLPNRSVDGLYHPDPPKYRFGFTPGGQYVDFYELPTFCTTKPLDFQKDSVAVKVGRSLNDATQRAEAALKAGDNAQAQAILEGASGE